MAHFCVKIPRPADLTFAVYTISQEAEHWLVIFR